jgi:hypothetical protein
MVVDRENTDAARINAHYLLFSLCERAENPVPVRRLVRKELRFSILSLSVPASLRVKSLPNLMEVKARDDASATAARCFPAKVRKVT